MITIDYSVTPYIINVPRLYTQFVATDPQTGLEVRQMNLTQFAQDIGDLQDNVEGAWAPTAYEYTAPVSVGGVQLAPVVVITEFYVVQFEDLQYAVNLVGANTNVQDQVVVNQVSIRPSNSAGLTFSDAINSQSFLEAAVWVDSEDGLPGTQFPRGTPPDEVDNVTDAITIALREGLHRFNIRGTFNAVGNVGIERYHVKGQTPQNAIIVANALNVTNSSFERIAIVGSITGRGTFQDCSVAKTLNLSGVEGIWDNCGIAGNLTLDASATEPIVFKDCISTIAGTDKPSLDCNGTAAGINFRRYAGGLAVTNFNNPAGAMTLDLMGSEVSIDSVSCTNGEIVARGVGKLIDENGNVIPNGSITINGNLFISNRLVNSDQVASGSNVWSEAEKDEVIQYSKKSSDNAEQANLKL